MEGTTGAELASRLGAALNCITTAIEECRDLDALTSTDRKKVNGTMDDLLCEHERLKLAHQRMLERAQNQTAGLPR